MHIGIFLLFSFLLSSNEIILYYSFCNVHAQILKIIFCWKGCCHWWLCRINFITNHPAMLVSFFFYWGVVFFFLVLRSYVSRKCTIITKFQYTPEVHSTCLYFSTVLILLSKRHMKHLFYECPVLKNLRYWQTWDFKYVPITIQSCQKTRYCTKFSLLKYYIWRLISKFYAI